MKRISFLFIVAAIACSCHSKEDMSIQDPPFITNAGNDFINVEDFSVTLNADELKPNEKGTWSIHSGMVDSKVYFNDKNHPRTVFHGLPGEVYKLIWELTNGKKSTADTVTVSFLPLQTEIVFHNLDFYETRLRLEGKMYEKGYWTIEGNYDHIRSLQRGGVVIPEQEFPYIMFYGFENTNNKITWTTSYGSKSVSATIEFMGGTYQQDEALEDLQILNDPSVYKRNENGDVTQIIMNGDRRAWMFSYLNKFPALKSLVHLNRLELQGNGLQIFPEVITSSYHKLKVLNLSANFTDSLPDNFGNLVNLDTLIMWGSKVKHIPNSFGNLKNLRYLELTGNYFTTLPESFSDLSSLNHLNIELNTIDKLPENFGNLKNLETFRGPTLLESIPNSFSNLEKLKFCFFYLQSSSAVLPEDFGRLTALETLWMHGNYLSIPNSFSNLKNLKDLEITRGSGIRQLPENFGELANLKSLRMTIRLENLPKSFSNLVNLNSMAFYGELKFLPTDIGKLKNLEWISVGHLKLQEIPESIGDLKYLKALNASTNNIPNIPASIGKLSHLTLLDVGRNKITHFPTTMVNLSNSLRELIIVENDYSDEEFEALKKMLPNTTITTRY